MSRIKLKKCLDVAFVLTTLGACAHHRDVRVSESGVHSVIIQTEFKDEGFDAARPQAEHFCEQSKKSVVIVEEKSEFVGDGQEEVYNRTKKIAKAAEVGGMSVAALGGQKERPIGAGVGVAAGVMDQALGQGYKYTLTFKCAAAG